MKTFTNKNGMEVTKRFLAISCVSLAIMAAFPCLAGTREVATSFNCSEKDSLTTPVDQFLLDGETYHFTRYDSEGTVFDR